jgi:hypothetical protein
MDWAKVDKSTLTLPQRLLVDYLTIIRDMRRNLENHSEYTYCGMEDFLLQHGKFYEPRPWRPRYVRGAPKSCFGNSILLGTLQNLHYIEGVAFQRDISFGFHHAWNVDDKDNLIDNTWLNNGLAYLGVEFAIGRADRATWDDDGTVLDNPRRRFDIYKHPWTGEDFSKDWGRSESLKVLDSIDPLEAMRNLRLD